MGTVKIQILSAANSDIDKALNYYSNEAGTELALRFMAALQQTLRVLSENPRIGTLIEFKNTKLEGIRRWSVQGFKSYLIFYRIVAGIIEVVRLLHAKRDLDSIFGG